MLDEAAACYSLNKDWPDARRCMREAARARKGPHLEFSLAAVRGLKIGDDGIIEFVLLNEMPAEARTIREPDGRPGRGPDQAPVCASSNTVKRISAEAEIISSAQVRQSALARPSA